MAQHHFIAQFRLRTGISQKALAALLQVSRTVLHMHERRGRLFPTAATLRPVPLLQLWKMLLKKLLV